MSTKFIDGPAKGAKLSLERAPKFLRVVEDPDGKIDALDQLDDEPGPTENIYVYRQVSFDGGGFLDYTDKKTGRRKGRMFQDGTYTIVDPQPDSTTMRDRNAWQAWCRSQLKPEEEKP